MGTDIQIGPTGKPCCRWRPRSEPPRPIASIGRLMAAGLPDAVHVPPVQRIRLRYAKRGRLRFSSHRDFARAFERSLRRAEIPMAYSAGFHPHPKISYVGAAPTGVASEAEYLEIALAERRDPAEVAAALDAVLPAGLDIVQAVDATDCPPGSLAERIEALLLAAGAGRGSGRAGGGGCGRSWPPSRCRWQRLTKDGRREHRRPRGRCCRSSVDRPVRLVGSRCRLPTSRRTACDNDSGRAAGHPHRSTRRCSCRTAVGRRFRPVGARPGYSTGAGTGRRGRWRGRSVAQNRAFAEIAFSMIARPAPARASPRLPPQRRTDFAARLRVGRQTAAARPDAGALRAASSTRPRW